VSEHIVPTGGTGEGVVTLADVGAELLEQARSHDSHRAARTITSGPSMRATVIALAAEAELAEHASPPAATLQVIHGQVRLSTEEREWLLHQGQVVTIPPQRHALRALTDTAVLLTVALR